MEQLLQCSLCIKKIKYQIDLFKILTNVKAGVIYFLKYLKLNATNSSLVLASHNTRCRNDLKV